MTVGAARNDTTLGDGLLDAECSYVGVRHRARKKGYPPNIYAGWCATRHYRYVDTEQGFYSKTESKLICYECAQRTFPPVVNQPAQTEVMEIDFYPLQKERWSILIRVTLPIVAASRGLRAILAVHSTHKFIKLVLRLLNGLENLLE